ncbi:MAG: hypothetical protein ACREKL_11815, partial [Chthoniobacterales bacterium]
AEADHVRVLCGEREIYRHTFPKPTLLSLFSDDDVECSAGIPTLEPQKAPAAAPISIPEPQRKPNHAKSPSQPPPIFRPPDAFVL